MSCQSEKNEIIALDRAYINYEKFEQMTQKGVVYVTKMKKNLVYEVLEDKMFQAPTGQMSLRVQKVVFKPKNKKITHNARIITYPDVKKKKLISLLTNDFDMSEQDIIDIYRKRWLIESLFKQIKQNFPLRYFYGESANAIKTQVWCTLIANLLLMIIKSKIKKSWSFSGLATMVRILLMHYLYYRSVLENPEKDWEIMHKKFDKPPNQLTLF